MASCKDCLHVEVCRYYTNELAKANGIPLKVEEIEGLLECDDCDNFKDRSRFVELPCSVGETVYRICPVENGKGCGSCPWEYCECHDIGFQNDRKNSIREGKANNFAWILKRIPYFRKIYFTTREAAAQALKEREKDE